MIKRHPVRSYLLIFYPLSWLFMLPALLGKAGLGVIPVDIPPQIGIFAATILGLTGIAFLVTRIADGKAGVRALRSHYLRFRTAPQWYVLALFGVPTLTLVMSILTRGTAGLDPLARHWPQVVTVYLINLIVIAILVSWCEEGGWMGFVTARLQRTWGPVLASVAVAPMFGFVHFPLLFVAGGVTDGRVPTGHLLEYAFYLLVLLSVPTRLVLTWLYNSSRGSLPVVAILHSSIDTTGSAAVMNAFFPGFLDNRIIFVGLAVVALGLIVATRGRLGYRDMAQQAAAVPAIPVVEAAS